MEDFDLTQKLNNIEENYLLTSRKNLKREERSSRYEFKELSRQSFSIKKDLLLFSGSLFGSSIALSSGKEVNAVFLTGEFLIFLSILLCLVMIKSDLKGKEWSWAFFAKNSYENFLSSSKKRVNEFELKIINDQIGSFQVLLKNNQSGPLFFLFKIFSYEYILYLHDLFLVSGIFGILISLLPVFS